MKRVSCKSHIVRVDKETTQIEQVPYTVQSISTPLHHFEHYATVTCFVQSRTMCSIAALCYSTLTLISRGNI